MTDKRALDPTQLSAYFALIGVSSRLRHAAGQQLGAAGEVSFAVPARGASW